jgi:hypothetical protein
MIFTIGKHCLFPRDDAASLLVNRGPPVGSDVELTEVRGSKFARGVHASLTRIGKLLNVRDPRNWLAIVTGHFEAVPTIGSTPAVLVPHAISSMTAEEFEAFWDDCKAVLLNDVAPHLPNAEAVELRACLQMKPEDIERELPT